MSYARRRCLGGSVVAAAVSCVLAWPLGAQAELEAGNPEAYENGALIGTREHSSPEFGYGQIHLESAQLGGEGIECVIMGFGGVWNEGTPLRAHGEVLHFGGGGHVPEGAHTRVTASCRPEVSGKAGSFLTAESFVRSEENGSHEVEPSLRGLSPGWNVELTCGVRNLEYVPIVKLGVADGEFPRTSSTPCPEGGLIETAEEEEFAEYRAEKAGSHGCYASNPAPAGCIHATLVEPGAGLEAAFGGTLYVTVENGVKNGLSPTRWKLEAGAGELQCEFPAGCGSGAGGTITGEGKQLGYTGLQLIQAK